MNEPDWWNEFKTWEMDFKKSILGEIALSKMKKKLGEAKIQKDQPGNIFLIGNKR